MANGYFQLLHKNNGTALRLVPPTAGDAPVATKEVRDYLDERGIVYDLVELNRAVSGATETTEVLLNDSVSTPFRQAYNMYISQDGLEVVMRFYPPSDRGEMMTPQEIMNDLRHRGIKYGIQIDNIEAFFVTLPYCTDVVVAQGTPARNGHDAHIEYFFETDHRAKPELREDGSVDFHNLNTICHCSEGQLLARLIPEDPGEEGKTVTGDRIKPIAVKRDKLKFGRNIRLTDDRLEIYSMVNGHVTLAGEQVFVSDVLELENVDVSTGNIEYEGGILIRGNVLSGYSVKAGGDIEIRGVVEGAEVTSDGNITIALGVNGMGRGVLKAQGNVVSKFIENATVIAGGFISTESILHSKVQAVTEIEVTGRKGFITGGEVTASNIIKVKTLGSPMGASTVVTVGVNPVVKREIADLQKRIAANKKTIAGIEPVLTAFIMKKRVHTEVPPEQAAHIQKLAQVRVEKKQELSVDCARLEELSALVDEDIRPTVEVMGEVYPGTKICILEVSMVVKSSMKYCRFVRERGDVKMTPL